MSTLYLFLCHGAAFYLGFYAASQFKFGEPIEAGRWVIVVVLFAFFGILSEIHSKDR